MVSTWLSAEPSDVTRARASPASESWPMAKVPRPMAAAIPAAPTARILPRTPSVRRRLARVVVRVMRIVPFDRARISHGAGGAVVARIQDGSVITRFVLSPVSRRSFRESPLTVFRESTSHFRSRSHSGPYMRPGAAPGYSAPPPVSRAFGVSVGEPPDGGAQVGGHPRQLV